MSVIKEHDRANYTKEKDTIERYLIRIIERYFEIQKDYSRATIESIVQESFTRLKRYMYHNNGFVFSLNHYTGHLSLDISFFNGERLIDNKNTAFNKDFGDEEDTICEGDDFRLYDARIPLEHYHESSDIPGLKDLLDLLNYNEHIQHEHKNTEVLDALKYVGTRTQIDLILLEDLQNRIQEYTNQVKYRRKEALEARNEYTDRLVIQLELLNRYFNELKQEVIEKAVNWIGLSYEYVYNLCTETLNLGIDKILPYKSDEYAAITEANFLRMDKLLYEGTFDLLTVYSSNNYNSATTSTIESSNPGITIYQQNTSPNKRIKMYFQYKNQLGQTIRTTLPFKFVTADKKQFIVNGRYNALNGIMEAGINCAQSIPINLDSPKRVYLEDTHDVYIPVLNFIDNSMQSTIDVISQFGADIPVLTESLHSSLETILNQINTEDGISTYKDRAYLINGNYYSQNKTCYKTFDQQTEQLTYYDSRITQAEKDGLINNGFILMKVDDNEPKNLDLTEQDDYFEDIGFILHYKDIQITEYFQSPKIYFQVFGGTTQ